MKPRKNRDKNFILLIDNYDSFTFNLYQYISELGIRCRVVRNDQISLSKIAQLQPRAIVLSPGPGAPDSAGITLEVVKMFSGKIPILGVCLGHQAIAQAFGGKVVRARRMMHGKSSQIHHNSRGIFGKIQNPFIATRYHSLIVERKSLPRCLEITAQTDDGLIMGIKHKKHNVVGVQFHPESIMTSEGKVLLANFFDE